MYDIDTARTANEREIRAMLDLAGALAPEDWQRPALPGWTVLDLVDHCARALSQQAEAFRRGLDGRTDAPEFPHPHPTTPGEATVHLADGLAAMQGVLARLGADDLDRITPMPFAPVPTALALQIAVVEYALHRVDLALATGDAAAELTDDAACTYLELAPGLAPMLGAAGRVPTEPGAYRLVAPGTEIVLAWNDGGWAPVGDTSAPTTSVSGSAAALAMYFMGRIGADHPALSVGGDGPAASAFKEYFPGP